MQDYKNHSQIVYSYYLFTGVPILILLGIGFSKVFRSDPSGRELGALLLLIGWVLLGLLFRSRKFALIAQDRAIRAEENLRYFILTGSRLDTKLTLSQVIALRFASDEELPSLAQRAAAENLKADDIKRSIRNWRADLHRV